MMNRNYLYLPVIIATLSSCSPKTENTDVHGFISAKGDKIFSKVLNEERRFIIYEPAADDPNVKQSFPVVYLLDGEDHFNTVVTITRQLSENMNLVLPKMIVVGILNTDRTRDLTPTHVSYDPAVPDSGYVRTSGGAGRFTEFLQNELIPYIDSAYSTAPFRVLAGHSLGGLYCINTLLLNSELFRGYIAIDPTFSWDNKKLLSEFRDIIKGKDFSGRWLYMAIANQGYSDTEVRKDNSAAFEFSGILDSMGGNGLDFRWHYYQDDNHGSVPLISEYDGLRYIFDFYNPRIPYTSFRDPMYDADSFMVAHFNEVSIKMGYKVFPPENIINWMGYLFIMEKQYDKSYIFFRRNIENYPGSSNVYDSMAELLLLKGDTTGAIENYRKSLSIDPGNVHAMEFIDNYGSK